MGFGLSQDLLQHIKQREKWKSESTAEKISWIAHRRELHRMDSTEKTTQIHTQVVTHQQKTPQLQQRPH